jgi:hypothetical protein
MLGGGGLTWHKDDAKNLLGAAWAGGGAVMIFEQEKSPRSCVAKGWFDMGI